MDEQKDILSFWIQTYFGESNLKDILSQSLCQKFLESSNRLLFVYQEVSIYYLNSKYIVKNFLTLILHPCS